MSETITGEQANAEAMAEYLFGFCPEAGELKRHLRRDAYGSQPEGAVKGDCRLNLGQWQTNDHCKNVFPRRSWEPAGAGSSSASDMFTGQDTPRRSFGEMIERSPGKPPRTA